MIRLALDVTALHGTRTGVGMATAEILERLSRRSEFDLVAYSVSWRGRHDTAALVPPDVRVVRRPMAAQPLRKAWLRGEVPPLEWFTGAVDLVHGPNFVVPPTRRAARVVTVHDLTPWRFPELATEDTRQYPALVARAVDGGAWVHTVSEWVADEVRELHPHAADRVVAVPNGVGRLRADGPATGAPRGRVLAGGDRYVLALGTVEPRKDMPGLVEAFDLLAAEDERLRLVLAGPDGWGADALARAIEASPHAGRVIRLGWVPDDDRAALLRGATVFAYPSRYEGFGLPPLEAMQAGTAVVTTTAGALPEVTGGAARLVEPGDPGALAGAIGALLHDEGARAELVAAGLERASRYTWEATVDGLVELYHHALGAR